MILRAILLLVLSMPGAAFSADTLETLLATDPVAAASRAFEAGNKRHIVLPVCQLQGGEVMPGWPLNGPTPPEMWEAIRNGQRPFGCEDLGEGTRSSRFLRLLKYAEQYNKKLLELEKAANGVKTI